MTEIPEHLLKRSRERRAALGGGSGDAGDAGGAPPPDAGAEAGGGQAASGAPVPATTAPRPAATPAPAPAPPPPPKPVPAYVRAAETRQKVPYWALPVVAALPLWLGLYVMGMEPVTQEVTGPLAEGEEVYSNCSSCHGAGGEGGVGYQLNGGEIMRSFDSVAQIFPWIAGGTAGYAGQPYGNGRHIGGQLGQMPAWEGQLSAAEIIAVSCHEYFTLGGADPTDERFAADYEQWCAPEAPGYVEVEESEELPAETEQEQADAEPEAGAGGQGDEPERAEDNEGGAGEESPASGEGGNTSGGEG